MSTPGKHKWGAHLQLHSIVTSIIDEGELLASGPDRFTGGWVGPRASRDVLKKKKNLLPITEFEIWTVESVREGRRGMQM
jgi:hypothetical protein